MKRLKNDEVALALLRLLQIALNGSIPQEVGKVEWATGDATGEKSRCARIGV